MQTHTQLGRIMKKRIMIIVNAIMRTLSVIINNYGHFRGCLETVIEAKGGFIERD